VGQTRRTLKTRIGEHTNRNISQSSVITDYRLKYGHDFDWTNVEVLDEEINLKKRFISETIHIKNQNHLYSLFYFNNSIDSNFYFMRVNLDKFIFDIC